MLANESAGVSTCHHSIPPVHGLSNLYLHAMEARVVWGNQKACSEKSPHLATYPFHWLLEIPLFIKASVKPLAVKKQRCTR